MRTVTLVVPAPPPPSLNVYLRMHWTLRRRLRRDWSDWLYALREEAGRPAFVSADVTVRYFYRTAHRRDLDNAIPKLLFDAMVDCRLLEDDNPDCLRTQKVEIHVDRDRPRVEIEIRGEELTAAEAERRSAAKAKAMLPKRGKR